MLALTDESLARLAIAATAVPPDQRGQWLRQIAERIERPENAVPKTAEGFPPTRRSSAARKRRYRERQAAGERCYTLTIADRDMDDVIAALIAYERLTESDACDHIKLETALSEAVVDVGRKWRDAFRPR
jgi:hypothetical protein